MRKFQRLSFRLAVPGALLAGASMLCGADRLTLKEAQEQALKNHPRLLAAAARQEASQFVPKEIRSRYFPVVSGSVTGAGAPGDNSRILAGGLNNPLVLSRFAFGATVSQLVADFGHTSHLAKSADLSARSQGQVTETTRAQIVLNVTRAFFEALRAQAVLEVAQETVRTRQLVVNQVETLARNKLKSELDVSFARVNLDEAKLLLSSAENDASSAAAQLSAALGLDAPAAHDLVDEQAPAELPASESTMIADALKNRPEAQQARFDVQAAEEFTRSERALRYPTIRGVVTSGYSPARVDRLDDHWVAGGVNIDLPFLNGGLFAAREAEAGARHRAAREQMRDVETQIARDVRVAYLGAVNAYQRLQLTAQLLEQASKALNLAQARYDLGLGTIVELTQAQLNVTRAQIAQTGARFEFQSKRATLNFERGIR